MKAIIRAGNVTRGLYIFENSDGEYGYFELLDGTDLEKDDVLIGDFTALAGETVRKADTGELLEIFIEDYCSLSVARDRIFG